MKTPLYETSAGALAAFLGQRPPRVQIADLYTFTFAGSINGGNTLTFTTSDVTETIPYGSGNTASIAPQSPVTYSASSVYFDQIQNKSTAHWKIGLDVDTWQVICTPSPQATIGGQPFLAACVGGVFDGATVTVDRAFYDVRSGAPSLVGVYRLFAGRVGQVQVGRSNVVFTLNDWRVLLQQNMPRNYFQATCRWQLYGAGCTLNILNFEEAGTVATATQSNILTVAVATPSGSGTYNRGQIEMTSGNNQGISLQIVQGINNGGGSYTFTLNQPFPFPINVGDTFNAAPGCSHLLGACISFNNQQNHGGFPYIPIPESAT